VAASGTASWPQLRQNRSFKGISEPQFEQIISFTPANVFDQDASGAYSTSTRQAISSLTTAGGPWQGPVKHCF
jgi:hypothetical protein